MKPVHWTIAALTALFFLAQGNGLVFLCLVALAACALWAACRVAPVAVGSRVIVSPFAALRQLANVASIISVILALAILAFSQAIYRQGLALHFVAARDIAWRSQIWDMVGNAFAIAVIAIAVAPALCQLRRDTGWRHVRAPLLGLAAALPVAVALRIIWQTLQEPFIQGMRAAIFAGGFLFEAVAWVPVVALLLTAGAELGVAALQAARGNGDTRASFANLLRAGLCGWVIDGAVQLARIAAPSLVTSGHDPFNSGMVFSVVATAVIAAAWITALWRLLPRVRQSAGTGRMALAATLLLVAFALSNVVPLVILKAGRTEISDAGGLVAIVMLPVLAALCVAIAMGVPWLLRSIVGETQAEPRSIS